MTAEMQRAVTRLRELGALLTYTLEESILQIDRHLQAGEIEAARKVAADLAAGIRRRRGPGLN